MAQQSSGEFASANPTKGEEDARVQERGIRAKISLNPRSHLQHFQRPTPSDISKNAPSLQGLSHAGVARSRRRRMISAVKPDEPASNFQQRDNARFTLNRKVRSEFDSLLADLKIAKRARIVLMMAAGQAVAIYSRIALCSYSHSPSRYLTMSPIDTRPTSFSWLMTGRWRERSLVIFSIATRTNSSSLVVITLVVMCVDTASLNTAAPHLTTARTISRSDKIPRTLP